MWGIITDFGDTAVTLPLAGFVLLWLAAIRRDRAAALAWVVGVTACGLAMAVLKLAGLSCGGAWVGRLVSPSGHAAVSTVVYGGLALMMVPRSVQAAPVLVAAGLVAAVAVSRLVLHKHTLMEVVAGLAVGAAALALMRRRLGGRRDALGWAWLPWAALLVLLLHGQRWPVESGIRSVAALIRAAAPGQAACRWL